MFMPAEAIFSQALETDPGLIEYAAGKGAMLATPTTLIAMLKTIAYAWNSGPSPPTPRRCIGSGRDLYERLSKVSSHLDGLGRSINGSVTAYNRAIGSMESASPGERA